MAVNFAAIVVHAFLLCPFSKSAGPLGIDVERISGMNLRRMALKPIHSIRYSLHEPIIRRTFPKE